MLNRDIIKKIAEQFGLVRALEFCKMEAYKYELLHKNSPKYPYDDPETTYGYEYVWWTKKCKEIRDILHGKTLVDSTEIYTTDVKSSSSPTWSSKQYKL